MEKHRNIVLTDATSVITNLGKNTENYMDAIKAANKKIASAQINLEVNETALENLEEFLTMIDLPKNQLKYTVSMISGIEDMTSSIDTIFDDDDDDDDDGYGARSSLVLEPFRTEAIEYEEKLNAERKKLLIQTGTIKEKLEVYETIIKTLIVQLKPLVKELERVRESQRNEEEELLQYRKSGELAMDGARKKLELKKIEIHQKVLDNKCVIENTNNIMKVYKANLDTDIKASYSEAAKKKMEEEEKPIKEKDRLTALKTLYDGNLLDDTEYKNKKKEELEKEENLEIKKLKEKLTSLEKLVNIHEHTNNPDVKK